VDALAITHADVPHRVPDLRICRTYRSGDWPWPDGSTGFGRSDGPAHSGSAAPPGGTARSGSAQSGGSTWDRIVPGPYRDLDHQAALCARIEAARPVLDENPPDDWPTTIGELLDRPVAVVSNGPTAADKHILTPIR
jgi:hypothetical protein